LKKNYPNISIDIVGGTDFPDDLTKYDLVITCGGCMFNRRYIMSRVDCAKKQCIAMTNYGIFIAYIITQISFISCHQNRKRCQFSLF